MSIQIFSLLTLFQSFLNSTIFRFLKQAPYKHVYIVKPPRPRSFSTNVHRRMPAGAWDSHMHVTSPDYPLAHAAYKPALHTAQDVKRFESTIGIANVVLVQPSIYGNDNTCLLDGLRAIGPRRARGVVEIDPDAVDMAELAHWHQLGVRGVRLNLKSVNASLTEAELEATLRRYANVVRPLGWVLELFIAMESLPVLDRLASTLDVRICLAHFGAPKLPPMEKRLHPLHPYELAGFSSLISLLKKGNVWVKMSAAYRFDEDPDLRGIEAVARELLQRAPERLVFASDWPHTRFDGYDVRPFVERCLEWTEAVGGTQKVFRDNAMELWDVR